MKRMLCLLLTVATVILVSGGLGAFSLFVTFPEPTGPFAVGLKRLVIKGESYSLGA